MNSKEVLEIVNEIDVLLSRTNVSGDSVFYICDSRRLLKQVYDGIRKQPLTTSTTKEGAENGG